MNFELFTFPTVIAIVTFQTDQYLKPTVYSTCFVSVYVNSIQVPTTAILTVRHVIPKISYFYHHSMTQKMRQLPHSYDNK